MAVVLIGFAEWRRPIDHNEQNDSKREKVSFPDIEDFRLVYFWRHVSISAQQFSVGSKALILDLVAQSEIDQFEVALIVENDVFEFEVTVRDTVFMTVFESVQKLFE